MPKKQERSRNGSESSRRTSRRRRMSENVPSNLPVVQGHYPHTDDRGDTHIGDRVYRELYKRNVELAVRNKTLALLRKLDEIAMGTLGMMDMAEEITSVIGTELGYEIVSLTVIDNERKNLNWLSISSIVLEITKVLRDVSIEGVKEPLRSSLLSVRALNGKEPIVAKSPSTIFPRSIANALTRAESSMSSIQSSLVYPLRLGREPLGVLTVSASRDLHDLSRYERESFSGIIGLIVLALYKTKIYEDLQRTGAELRVANTRLAQLDQAKSEFLSIASHQLYTPLTAIKGYLSMLQEKDFGELSKEQRPVIDILRQSSDRLIDLIRNLLDVSRIESGRLELSLESLDLVAMARDLVKELTPNAQRKSLALNFHEPDRELPHVVADAQRLRQVLLNMLDNAIKYTPAGKIDVRVVPQNGGTTLAYSVQDTGKGIDASEINQLFTKFARLGGADRYHTEGTGLGLYVARQIVREHHGDIWVESPGHGKGSTFSMKLPTEGTEDALPAGTKVTVGIKAAEAGKA